MYVLSFKKRLETSTDRSNFNSIRETHKKPQYQTKSSIKAYFALNLKVESDLNYIEKCIFDVELY